MFKSNCLWRKELFILLLCLIGRCAGQSSAHGKVGQEVAVPVHLKDGDESKLPISQLIDYGRQLFTAACEEIRKALDGR